MNDIQTTFRKAQDGGLLKFVPHAPINRLVLCVLSALIFCSMAADCQAQDDVVITKRTGKNGTASGTLKRKGTITQWKGLSLTIFSSGTEREIDNDNIVEVKTTWSEDYIAGLNAIRTGQTVVGRRIQTIERNRGLDSRVGTKTAIEVRAVATCQTRRINRRHEGYPVLAKRTGRSRKSGLTFSCRASKKRIKKADPK